MIYPPLSADVGSGCQLALAERQLLAVYLPCPALPAAATGIFAAGFDAELSAQSTALNPAESE